MPKQSLGIVVVIPCFNEPDIKTTIRSLYKCYKPCCRVEVIVVVNFSESESDDIKANCYKNYNDLLKFSEDLSDDSFTIHPILKKNIASKYAGVGLARKIGMDEAAFRFKELDKPNGLILCFDADSTCDLNYFIAIENHYNEYKNIQASSIYYEHPVQGTDFPEEIYSGITQYELHLRYYNQATKAVGFPFAFHTVGSSMCCTASSYAKAGGMNRRKAGEDFYFLQKLIQLGHYSEINTTRIIPSPRMSDRVPFGTGRAMMKFVNGKLPIMLTYSLESFVVLKDLLVVLPELYNSSTAKQNLILEAMHPLLSSYLMGIDFNKAVDELNENCADYNSFVKRFFRWFDAFRLLKFMNWIHEDNRLNKKPIVVEAKSLLSMLNYNVLGLTNECELLKTYRSIERKI